MYEQYEQIANELFGKVGIDGEIIIFSLKTYKDKINNDLAYKAIVLQNNMIVDESEYHNNRDIVKQIIENFKNKYGVKK